MGRTPTWDGMSEYDALLAIDGGGKWVLASDHQEALTQARQQARDEALEEAARYADRQASEYRAMEEDTGDDVFCDCAIEWDGHAIAIRALKSNGGGA